jgi:hypothetical protein
MQNRTWVVQGESCQKPWSEERVFEIGRVSLISTWLSPLHMRALLLDRYLSTKGDTEGFELLSLAVRLCQLCPRPRVPVAELLSLIFLRWLWVPLWSSASKTLPRSQKSMICGQACGSSHRCKGKRPCVTMFSGRWTQATALGQVSRWELQAPSHPGEHHVRSSWRCERKKWRMMQKSRFGEFFSVWTASASFHFHREF